MEEQDRLFPLSSSLFPSSPPVPRSSFPDHNQRVPWCAGRLYCLLYGCCQRPPRGPPNAPGSRCQPGRSKPGEKSGPLAALNDIAYSKEVGRVCRRGAAQVSAACRYNNTIWDWDRSREAAPHPPDSQQSRVTLRRIPVFPCGPPCVLPACIPCPFAPTAILLPPPPPARLPAPAARHDPSAYGGCE